MKAPTDEEHLRMIQHITLGAKLELFSWASGQWITGEVVKMFHNDVWQIKCENDLPGVEPGNYHLRHYWVRKVQCPGLQLNNRKRKLYSAAPEQEDKELKRSKRTTNSAEAQVTVPEEMIEVGRHWCPVSYCNNYGGRGFKKLAVHIEGQHKKELINEGDEKEAIIKALDKLNKIVCRKCNKIRTLADKTGTCLKCVRERLTAGEKSSSDPGESPAEISSLLESIAQADRTKMNVLAHVPKDLCRKWSQVLTSIILEWSRASSTVEALRAVHKWHKVKSVIVRPVRGGRKRRTGGFRMWNANMDDWLAGQWEQCWDNACDIESRRRSPSKKANVKPIRIPDNKEEKQWKSIFVER